MPLRQMLFALTLLIAAAATSSAGTIYKVTAKKGDETVTYEVRFGGGRLAEYWTAFDPKTKKFVHLTWLRRGGKEPEPAATIWDHRTGELIKLYKFPGADSPLPVIPGIEAMKACPITGDRKFKAVRHIAID
jgi:hypothetical protein